MTITLNSEGLWNIVRVGTIGWMKCKDNTIRQCKCVNAYFELDDKVSIYKTAYEWLIGGIGVRKGTCSRIEGLGIIYKTEVDALVSTFDTRMPHQSNIEMFPNYKVDILGILEKKYDLSPYCFNRIQFTEYYELKTFAIFKDNTINLLSTDFQISWSERGVIDIRIPMLEEGVNGIHRYPTRAAAMQHVRQLKVYTLDDMSTHNVAPTTKVKLTIEIETNDIENIKKFAKILN